MAQKKISFWDELWTMDKRKLKAKGGCLYFLYHTSIASLITFVFFGVLYLVVFPLRLLWRGICLAFEWAKGKWKEGQNKKP